MFFLNKKQGGEEMNNNDMDPFTKNDDPTTDTEDSLNRLKELLGEQNSSNNTQSRTDVKMTRSSSGKPRRKNFLKAQDVLDFKYNNFWKCKDEYYVFSALK